MSIFYSAAGKVLGAYLRWQGRRRLASHAGRQRLRGLKAEVEIYRDGRGVPHIFAEDRHDLFFAQGFSHAQDRFWQIEMNRRIATGTVAEVFGKPTLDIDRISRTMGFSRLAKADLAAMDKETLAIMESYVAGVNAWMEMPGRRLPVEFKLSRHKPQPYRVEELLAVSRLLSMQLSVGWAHELVRARLIALLGPEKAAGLDIRHSESNPVTLPDGIEVNEFHGPRKPHRRGFDVPFQGGSNAWAISGRHTDTGKPYLCSDPHLSGLAPSIWYQNLLRCPDYEAIGVSIPGMPLVMIGHNAHISWGITLAFTDIQDLFAEQFDDSGKHYKVKDEWQEVECIREEIKVKGSKEAHVEEVCNTRHGPIVSDVLQTGSQKLALSSMALQCQPIVRGWRLLNEANGWGAFREAMHAIEAPGLNIVYADVHGNIGYWNTGRTPVRGMGAGETPGPGWSGEYDWVDEVPFDQMPHTLNPSRGYVISANNRITPQDYEHFIGNVWMNGYRAARLELLIGEQIGKKPFTRSDFPALHTDFQCIPGRQLASYFVGLKPRKKSEAEVLKALIEWDGELDAETVGGTIYQICKRQMLKLLTQSELDSDLRNQLRGKGLHPLFFKVNEFHGKEINLLLEHLERGDTVWIQAAGGRDKLLADTLSAATQWLKKRLGPDVSKWRWGRLHQISFQHAMGGRRPLNRIFNVGPRPCGGDTDTVCQMSFPPEEPFEATLACPSYRHIVDLSNLDNSLWVMPPGVSGQLGSPHYEDQFAPWLRGEYFPMRWERHTIESEATGKLSLMPRA